jgi:hypothetical protein
MSILINKEFYDFVKTKYSVGNVSMVQSDDLDKALEQLEFENE